MAEPTWHRPNNMDLHQKQYPRGPQTKVGHVTERWAGEFVGSWDGLIVGVYPTLDEARDAVDEYAAARS